MTWNTIAFGTRIVTVSLFFQFDFLPAFSRLPPLPSRFNNFLVLIRVMNSSRIHYPPKHHHSRPSGFIKNYSYYFDSPYQPTRFTISNFQSYFYVELTYSKVPLLVLEVLSGVGKALVNACSQLLTHAEKHLGIPDQVFDRLKNADIHLRHDTAAKLWQEYGSEFEVAIAYVTSKKDINDKAAYFRKCLEQGWVKNTKPETQKHDPYKLSPEQEQWHNWAQECGLCEKRPLNYALVGGEVAVLIFEPEFHSFSPPMPLSRAMQKYPMV